VAASNATTTFSDAENPIPVSFTDVVGGPVAGESAIAAASGARPAAVAGFVHATGPNASDIDTVRALNQLRVRIFGRSPSV